MEIKGFIYKSRAIWKSPNSSEVEIGGRYLKCYKKLNHHNYATNFGQNHPPGYEDKSKSVVQCIKGRSFSY